MNKKWFVLLLMPVSALAKEKPLSAREIMDRSEKAHRFDNVIAEASLKNTTKDGNKVKEFTWWRKIQPDQTHYKTVTRFKTPAEIRNESILFLEQSDGQAEVLLYLPNFKKTRRVERQAQSGSFMSSEFSYSDIATPHPDDFSYQTLKKDKCPDGGSCTVVEAKPRNDDIKERLGYSRQVHWIRDDNFMESHGEYYDLQNKLYKKFDASVTKEVKKGHWLSHKLRIENVRNGNSTVMEFKGVKVNDVIPDAKFTQQALERGL